MIMENNFSSKHIVVSSTSLTSSIMTSISSRRERRVSWYSPLQMVRDNSVYQTIRHQWSITTSSIESSNQSVSIHREEETSITDKSQGRFQPISDHQNTLNSYLHGRTSKTWIVALFSGDWRIEQSTDRHTWWKIHPQKRSRENSFSI